jgi:putative Ca2+/H+ antiporter (TMEM165/GDT1 family)
MKRINGETVTGIALIFLALLFIIAGTVNSVWALLFWADILILVIGVAFVVLGLWSLKRDRDHTHAEPKSET